MKKLFVALLVLTMVLSCTACGKKKPKENNTNKPTETAAEPTAEPTEPVAKPTEPVSDPENNPVPEGAVTDPTKLGESITYWVDGDYLYFKIKTSAKIDAKLYDIDIVNPGFYLTRESERITQEILDEIHCLDDKFDKEWFDGYYVFALDNTRIIDLASGEWAPGTWSMLLYNGDTGIVLGQWFIVLEGGSKYHFEFKDSWLVGAGEDRKVKEFDSLQDEVASWFTFNKQNEEWADFFFDGYYLETIDPSGYDGYFLMVCPEGDYATYQEAMEAHVGDYGTVGSRCPYKFSIYHESIKPGKYTMVLARSRSDELGVGGNVEIQFGIEKIDDENWKFDFSNAKCPALNSKYGVVEDPVTPDGDPENGNQGSESVSALLASVGLSEADIQTSLGFALGTPTESDAQYVVSAAYDSADSFKNWVEAIAESCRKAAKDGNIYESEFSTEPLTSFDIDESAVINMVQFIYKTTGKVVYVTLSSAGSEENTFSCNIQIY